MELVKFKNSLSKHAIQEKLLVLLDESVKKIGNYGMLKLNMELTAYVCNLVENYIKAHAKFDKKQIVVDALTQAFTLSPDEVIILENQIQYLWDNGKVKKIPMYKYAYKYAVGFLVKQVS